VTQALTEELVAQALGGERTAVRSLVRALSPVVHARVARVLLRSRDRAGRDIRADVEDLTQELFLELFAGSGKALRAWKAALGMSLPNFVGFWAEMRVRSFMRSRGRNPWPFDPAEDGWIALSCGGAPPPEDRVEALELLTEVCGRLQPREAVLFELHYVEERDAAEIAERLQTSPGAVHQALHRLRDRLSKIGAEILSGSRRKTA
jgi:RNA polymerase sigma factor (sigma-70 family)